MDSVGKTNYWKRTMANGSTQERSQTHFIVTVLALAYVFYTHGRRLVGK